MKLNIYTTASIILIFISLLIGAVLYPQLPDYMASHWNISGSVDGYMPKLGGLLVMPLISAVLLLVFLVLPGLDPKRNNIEKFRSYYDRFIFVIIAFLFYVYILNLSWNLGYRFVIMQALAPAFAGLFYYIGVLMENAKQNYFIGIRTPWTLSNEHVWDKTHKLGGKLFKAGAIILLLGFFFPQQFFIFMMVAVAASVLFSFGYSYYLFNKIDKIAK